MTGPDARPPLDGETSLRTAPRIRPELHHIANARDEGFTEVAEWLETLARAEKSHAGRFTQGLGNVS